MLEEKGGLWLTFEVASSRTRMRVACRRARAMHSNWRCPVLILLPPSPIGESRPPYRTRHH